MSGAARLAGLVLAGLLLLPVVLVGAVTGTLTPTQPAAGGRGAVGLATAAVTAGFTGQGLRVAVAVGLAESGGDPHATGHNPPTPGCPAGSTDRGGWQLNDCYHAEVGDACAFELGCAAREVWRISNSGSDWTPWTTYRTGAYLARLAAADRAIAALVAGVPSGFGTPGPCGLAPAADYTRHLIVELFAVSDIGGCDPDFRGHVDGSDHYPDANGQAHALDVTVGANSGLGWQVATWAAANATALQVKYVLFAGQIIDFRVPDPRWHRCRDPASSCARDHDRHVHLSFNPTMPAGHAPAGLLASTSPGLRAPMGPVRLPDPASVTPSAPPRQHATRGRWRSLAAAAPVLACPAASCPLPVAGVVAAGPQGRVPEAAEQFLLDPWGTLARWASQLAHHAGWLLPRAAMLLLTGVLVAGGGRAGTRWWRRRRLEAGARLVAVLPPPQVEPGAAEALWANLAGLLRQRRPLDPRPHVSFELCWTTQGVTVGVWVPGTIAPRLVERAVEAAWPGARARVADATPPLRGDAGTAVLGGELRLAGGPWQPLRTEHWVDPLRAVLGAASELTEHETAVVQVLARPAGGRRLVRAERATRALAGASTTPTRLVGGLLDLLTPGAGRTGRRPAGAADPLRTAEARAALTKLAGLCWETHVRYGVAGPDRAVLRGRLRARAHALSAAYAVHTGLNRLARRRLWHPARILATRPLHGADLLSTGELASLAHLPVDPAVPGLARAGARPVPPPPGLPTSGKVLGDTELGSARPVLLTPADACYHTHLLGATGSGKSTLICNLALADIHAGRGVVVVDPKGDLVGDLLERLPKRALERLVLLDPDERAAPPTLNPLEGDDPDLAVDHLVGILHRIWIAHWGPRIDDVLRASCLTLLRRPGATLADIPRLLADPVFRQPYLDGLDDPVGLGGFWAWYEQQSPAAQAQMVGPIMTRLRAFLLRSFVRDVVGSATSSFDMGRVLDGGVCLVRVPKGVLGDDTSRLLGSFVVARVWQAATARARTGQRLRQPASLYVDECQNFLTLPYRFEELLPEARGYGLALHLAHQHLGQLPRELHDALSANARTKVYFACSPEDARALERHVHPHLSAYDLAHLGAYQAAVRPIAAGTELPPCTIRTRPAPTPIPGRAAQARAAARTRFGRTPQQRRDETLQREYASGDDPRLPGPIPLPPPAPSTQETPAS